MKNQVSQPLDTDKESSDKYNLADLVQFVFYPKTIYLGAFTFYHLCVNFYSPITNSSICYTISKNQISKFIYRQFHFK